MTNLELSSTQKANIEKSMLELIEEREESATIWGQNKSFQNYSQQDSAKLTLLSSYITAKMDSYYENLSFFIHTKITEQVSQICLPLLSGLNSL